MKVVFIAGPFRAANAWLVEQNIRRAEELAFRVAELGATPLCPHSNTRFFNGTLTDEFWLEATKELLRRCDAMILVEDWRGSDGTKGEIEEAGNLAMPIFHSLAELAGWLEVDE